jgi:hypothetical protein
MEVVGERRTAHSDHQGAVARVERAGFRRGGQVLLVARVLVYRLGELS